MVKDLKLIVSTDCCGLLGTPKDWNDLWGFVKSHPKFAGFEMIAWGGVNTRWSEKLLREAAREDCRVVGIHGRTGKILGKVPGHSRWEVFYGNFAYNEPIVSTKFLLEKLAPQVEYVLLHNTELRSRAVQKLVLGARENFPLVFVENGLEAGDVVETLEIAKELKSQKVSVGLTFDLFHYYFTLPKEFPVRVRWEKVLERLDEFLAEAAKGNFATEIHLPLGERLTDSLPEEIGLPEITELGALIKGRIDYLCLEQQPWNRDFLFPTRKSRARLLERNKRNVGWLERAGIL